MAVPSSVIKMALVSSSLTTEMIIKPEMNWDENATYSVGFSELQMSVMKINASTYFEELVVYKWAITVK